MMSSNAVSDASSADVNQATVAANQTFIKNATLDQSEKRRRTQEAQSIGSDAWLSNSEKMLRLQEIVDTKVGAAGAVSGASRASPASCEPAASDMSPASKVSDADVSKTNFAVTQALMRNTALEQADKSKRIRETQRIASDSSLSNGEKVRLLQDIADAAREEAGSGKLAPSPPPVEHAKMSAAFAPYVREEKEKEKVYEKNGADADANADVDLATFKSEVIQGLIKDKAIAGEQKKKRIQIAHVIMRDESLTDSQKVDRLMQVKQGKDLEVPIGDSVFAPPPAVIAPPGAAVGHDSSSPDERLRAKMAGGAGAASGGVGARVTGGATANQRLRAKMMQGQGGAATASAHSGVSARNATANDRLRGKEYGIGQDWHTS